jgi:hypothetical protein
MDPTINIASDEGNGFEEGGATETATEQVGTLDESKNQRRSCPGKRWEFVFCTAVAIGSLCFLFFFRNRLPMAISIGGATMIIVSYCLTLFWECKGSEEIQQPTIVTYYVVRVGTYIRN